MKGKIYSPDEVSQMIPLVSRVADDIVATYRRIQDTLRELELERSRLGDGFLGDLHATGSESASRAEALDRRMDQLLERFQGYVVEIEALGGSVKDYELGCIDFYGEVDGEIVYYCWQRGESTVSHWHRLDEGYAERHAIPMAHRAA